MLKKTLAKIKSSKNFLNLLSQFTFKILSKYSQKDLFFRYFKPCLPTSLQPFLFFFVFNFWEKFGMKLIFFLFKYLAFSLFFFSLFSLLSLFSSHLVCLLSYIFHLFFYHSLLLIHFLLHISSFLHLSIFFFSSTTPTSSLLIPLIISFFLVFFLTLFFFPFIFFPHQS